MIKKESISILFSPIHYILDANNSGSEFSWSYQIYKYIKKIRQIDAIFITGGTRGINDKSVISCNIFNPIRLNLSIINVIYFYFKIFIRGRGQLKKKRFDIIHHVLPFGDNSFNLLAIFSNIKFIVGPIQPPLSVQDVDVDMNDSLGFKRNNNIDIISFAIGIVISVVRPFLYFLSITTIKRAEKIIVVNEHVKNKLIKEGVSKDKIVIIPPGIESERFKPIPFTKKNKDRVEILAVGSLRKRKSIDVIILALSQVVRKYRNVRLTIIGDGPQKESLVKMVNKLSLEKYIEFKGFIQQEEIARYYSQSHILINMSKAEGFATVSLEAMASGLAIISSRVGGFMDSIDDGYNGFIIEIDDHIALANKISTLIENKNLINEFGKRARKKTEDKYDWEKCIIPQYLKIYSSLHE